MPSQVIALSVPVNDVDYGVFGMKGKDKLESLSLFLTEELLKTGGNAIVEVDESTVEVQWLLPNVSENPDPLQIAYVAHLLQVGLLADPSKQVAEVAYSGGLPILALNLLSINSSGKNRYLAERDAKMLAKAAPMSVEAMTMLGLILLENGKVDEASCKFMDALCFEPLDFLPNKYGAIALTLSDPIKAVKLCEIGIDLLAMTGVALDQHMRATYGMALLSAGLVAEAGLQLMLACGSKDPAMTPEEWVGGGYRIKNEDVPAALNPGKA